MAGQESKASLKEVKKVQFGILSPDEIVSITYIDTYIHAHTYIHTYTHVVHIHIHTPTILTYIYT